MYETDISEAELKLSGYVRLSSEDLRYVAIYNSMRRDRFENIKILHFHDKTNLNYYDYDLNGRTLIFHLHEAFRRHYIPSQEISHDEAMVEYFGKISCKHPIRDKTIGIRYKAWCQCTKQGI